MRWSATKIAEVIRSRELSCEDAMREQMTRIEEVNPRLNAAVQLCAERSLDEAHAADQALARGEEDVALAIAYYLEQAFGV